MQSKNYEIWKEKSARAKANMELKQGNNGVLIEVAAQHPLKDGCWPNEEFEKRLLLAAVTVVAEVIFSPVPSGFVNQPAKTSPSL